MKRLLSLTALLFLAVASFAHDFEVGGIYYVITSSTTVSVSYKGRYSTEYSGEYTRSVTIPETVTNRTTNSTYSVTSIGSDAFSRCSGLTSITIPSSVTSIGEFAFWKCI